MNDDMFDAERLAAAIEGAISGDAQTRALTSMAQELSGVLQEWRLNEADRARIWAHSMRLVEGAGADGQARWVWERVHVSRRGGAVLGGVAAASIAAAIGYAVIHERKQRSGLRRIAA